MVSCFSNLLRNLHCLFSVRSQYSDSCIHHTVIIMLATESKYQEFNKDNYGLNLVIHLLYLLLNYLAKTLLVDVYSIKEFMQTDAIPDKELDESTGVLLQLNHFYGSA